MRPWLTVGREIADVLQRVDEQSMAVLTEALGDTNRRWFFSGQGRSALVAQMAAMRFMHLGHRVHFVGEVSAPSIRKGDGLVISSGSGETPISLSFARIAKEQGAMVTTLTYRPNGSLATMADVVLAVLVIGTAQFGGSLFEQASLILLDSVALDLAASMQDAHTTMAFRHTNLQ